MCSLPSIRLFVRVVAMVSVGLLTPCTVHASGDGAVVPTTMVPIQVRSGHIHVDVEINGSGPLHFIFDTGAFNILTPAAARRLSLAVSDNLEATGTGGSQAGGSTRVDSVRLGAATLTDQVFYVLELPAGVSDDGPVVDGLTGFEWLEHFAARLDYADATLTLYPSKDFRYSGRAQPAPLSFRGRTPQISGKVDGIEGRFSLDTGSPGSLTLSAPFVAEHDLQARYHATTRTMSARGIGGPVYALVARAELLDLGTATVTRPVTFLSQQVAGTSVVRTTAGNIGYGVLRQFTIFFDYSRKQAFFEPNAAWGQVDLADRSGLRLERSADAFTVVFVAEASPAATAGLKPGDRIVAVDAASAGTLTLDNVRGRLKGPVGTSVSLSLDTGSTPVFVLLADL